MGDPKGLGGRDGEDLKGINEAQWEDGINEPSYSTGLFHDPALESLRSYPGLPYGV